MSKEVVDFIETTQAVEMYGKLFNKKQRESLDPETVNTLSSSLQSALNTKNLKDAKLAEMFTSAKAELLVPQIVVGAVLEGAEPNFLVSSLFETIQYTKGSTIQFPALGELRAGKVREGQEYPESEFDMTSYRNMASSIEKFGVAVKFTEEALADANWDIMGYSLRAAGRAMARTKEEQCLHGMLKFAHTVFDADSGDADYQVTGLDGTGTANKTLSIFDFIDLMGTLMYNDHDITDIIMHPLAWMTFLKNSITGGYDALFRGYGQPWGTSPKALGNVSNPASIVQRVLPLPFGVNIIMTPYAPLDRVNKKFDIIAIDRKNLGIIAQREALTTESFDQPERDVTTVKIKERYGVAIADDGRGIAVAKNLVLAPTYNPPLLMQSVT